VGPFQAVKYLLSLGPIVVSLFPTMFFLKGYNLRFTVAHNHLTPMLVFARVSFCLL
jgi:hypothetical protein